MLRYLPSWLFLSDSTWKPPYNGTYMIIAVGKGGDGGFGGACTDTGTATRTVYAKPGAGGGAGAVCVYVGEFTTSQNIPIVVSASETNFNSGFMVAGAGTNGGHGGTETQKSKYDVAEVPAGKAGTASGTGKFVAYLGTDGAGFPSGNAAYNYTLSGGRGGSVSVCFNFPPIGSGGAGVGAFQGPVENGSEGYAEIDGSRSTIRAACGAMYGGGGEGGGACGKYNRYMSNSDSLSPSGAKGGPGCVLIQLLEAK